ncbi:MAG TPA: maltose alpha-D-glucosyltransferase [Kofleriaceae bacterium]|nr:maltose alpha-D-glucosyltransferase [Kofleriaceae bacterium]
MTTDTGSPSFDDPLWFRDAVIYELHVRAFADSNGDGIGDFPGLITRLDYLRDLGVTALWLLPFYPSPLRDDGYDISDYRTVNPIYGTLDDFRRFLDAAHERGLRVITELVINHTSNEHPWFQRARRAAPGTVERDFYVWSDTPERYRGTRIIFQDFETSNWTWDPVADAYFWHRFYHHQPDLNFDSPAVKQAIFEALDFWMEMGVDGLRLDAVPYLYEREGTNNENLPETHEFLRELRRHIDRKFIGRMLLAEANQWPEDAASYFGKGDECHMNFHFPLMPRLFMGLQQEQAFPILDILEQTPAIPESCQWAVFLRNHDELTLEMVTDQDRDYMWRVYAEDPQARINVGIRRRLAPLLKERRKIELMNALLMSMPGTPVLYYGDEIGMGDNFYLGDRNGVRTPMQWTGDRNAGFSRANPQKLFLPVIIDPEYHYESVNVEAQEQNPQSFLWWTKRLIALRKNHDVFGRGKFEFLRPENPKVLAFVRSYQDQHVLVVANLSRFSQAVHLDLSLWRGVTPIELFGNADFPQVGEQPYLLTLSPHAFFWLSLSPRSEPAQRRHHVPSLSATGSWQAVLSSDRGRRALERALPGFLGEARWFRGKADVVRVARIVDDIPVAAPEPFHLLLVEVEYVERQTETYLLPIGFAAGKRARDLEADHRAAVVARLLVRPAPEAEGDPGVLYDAAFEPGAGEALLALVSEGKTAAGTAGRIIGHAGARLPALLEGAGAGDLRANLLGVEQSNTSISFGGRVVLKILRQVEDGANPDLEISRYLTEHSSFTNTPALGGWIEYRSSVTGRKNATVGLLHQFVPNQGDAWQLTLDSIHRSFEWALSHRDALSEVRPPDRFVLALCEEPRPGPVDEFLAGYIPHANLLGERTADLHLALSQDSSDPGFRPEEFSTLHQRSLYQAVRTGLSQNLDLLKRRLFAVPEDARPLAERVLERRAELDERMRRIHAQRLETVRVRVHGDYHLGQVLFTGNDFVIIDFEGEPNRSIGDRRYKRSPLRDVAGMLRSFHYASAVALTSGRGRQEDIATLEPWARAWHRWVSAAFLTAYLARSAGAPYMPSSKIDLEILLDFYLVEKCAYELGYELSSRPDWVSIPLAGLNDLLRADPVARPREG